MHNDDVGCELDGRIIRAKRGAAQDSKQLSTRIMFKHSEGQAWLFRAI
jgi:hypothetical protein